jgi:hypothetical protein
MRFPCREYLLFTSLLSSWDIVNVPAFRQSKYKCKEIGIHFLFKRKEINCSEYASSQNDKWNHSPSCLNVTVLMLKVSAFRGEGPSIKYTLAVIRYS